MLWGIPPGGGYSEYILVGGGGGSLVRAHAKKGGHMCGLSPQKRGVLGAGTTIKRGGGVFGASTTPKREKLELVL